MGITSIYVTHDQIEAMSISDRIVIMNHGRIEQVGSPQEIYAKPRNRFVADFIGKVNFITTRVSGPGQALLLDQTLTVEDLPTRLPGTPVVLTLRPEAVCLARSGGQSVGQVIRAASLGGSAEYALAVAGLVFHATGGATADENARRKEATTQRYLVFLASSRLGVDFQGRGNHRA